jgi:hypothetical protein
MRVGLAVGRVHVDDRIGEGRDIVKEFVVGGLCQELKLPESTQPCGRDLRQREWLMARRKPLRSQIYRDARDLGNIQAASKGPTAYGKRVVRRKVYRTTNGVNQRVLRELGL